MKTVDLPTERSENVFEDFKPAYGRQQAETEANRCLFCEDAPCIQACPTSIDIPQFIRKITTGNVEGSARTIFDANILGMSCARVCPVEVLCVGDCVFNAKEEPPIQIGKLQRYATDLAYKSGRRFYEAGPDSGKSVAIVGAGPAALAAAHELRVAGHAVTLYEKRNIIGGLNATGVAPYKMPSGSAVDEASWVLAIGGIDVELGVEVGGGAADSPSFVDLDTKHDALLLAFGLGPDSRLSAEGESLDGVVGAVDYIEQFKLGMVVLKGIEKAVVIGGGNTALDAVRELKGLGIPDVTLAYRGQESGMSGYAHEWKAGKVEGVRWSFGTQPTGFVAGEDGRVSKVQCIALDKTKTAIEGSEFELDADLVLVAIGQGKLGALVADLEGVVVERGCIVVDDNQQTGRPGVYAAGDAANGGTEVVYAANEGKKAAQAIDMFLKGL